MTTNVRPVHTEPRSTWPAWALLVLPAPVGFVLARWWRSEVLAGFYPPGGFAPESLPADRPVLYVLAVSVVPLVGILVTGAAALLGRRAWLSGNPRGPLVTVLALVLAGLTLAGWVVDVARLL
jgi:hypothetical protein